MLNAKKLKVKGITLSNPKKIEILETTIRLQHEGRLKLLDWELRNSNNNYNSRNVI